MVGSTTSASAAPAGLTEIELERLENIKRNRAVLDSVGLGGKARNHDEAMRQKKKPKPKHAPPPRQPTEPTRRSMRNLGKEAPDYREDAINLTSSLAASSLPSRPRARWTETEGEDLGPGEAFDAEAIRQARAAAVSSGPAPGSSRTLDADLGRVLGEYLGKKVPFTGKQCVMDLLTPEGSGYAKFSKYAGVVEWRNAVVLWVNVDGGDYDNLFLKGGSEMTWFAGSRVTAETPVMLRLIEAGKDVEKREKGEKGKGDTSEILLFCRLQGEPYVFMGRVYHEWYETRRHPIKMIWRLRDWEAIKESSDVKEIVGEKNNSSED